MERLQEAESGLTMKLWPLPEERGAAAEVALESASSEEQCSGPCSGCCGVLLLVGDMISALPPLYPCGVGRMRLVCSLWGHPLPTLSAGALEQMRTISEEES